MYTPPKLARTRTVPSMPSPATSKPTPVRPTATFVARQVSLGREKSPLGHRKAPSCA